MVVRDGVEPSYVVFQTTAPTAYATQAYGDAAGTRTRIVDVKGQCPDRLDDGTMMRYHRHRRNNRKWIQRIVTEVAYADLCLAYSFCPSTAAFCGVSPLLSISYSLLSIAVYLISVSL